MSATQTTPARTTPHYRAPPKRLGAARHASLVGMGRYSHFVWVMKRALPAAAGLVALAVLAYTLAPRDTSRAWIAWQRTKLTNDRTMLNPRLFGADDSGAPFLITADTAVQDGPTALHVRLHAVKAQMDMKDGLWVRLSGTHGAINSQIHQLDLTDGVVVTADGGYEAHSQRAHFDMQSGVVSGHDPVAGRGPFGTYTAHGFEVHKAERQLVFTGGVYMLLNAASAPAPPKPAGPVAPTHSPATPATGPRP